jgi:hypothetical protein
MLRKKFGPKEVEVNRRLDRKHSEKHHIIGDRKPRRTKWMEHTARMGGGDSNAHSVLDWKR